jgi:hypothetical protein
MTCAFLRRLTAALFLVLLTLTTGSGQILGQTKDSELRKTKRAQSQVRVAQEENPKCELSGHVIDEKGQLVPFAEIYLWKSDETKFDVASALTDRLQADADGRFVIPNLPAGEVFAFARLPRLNVRGDSPGLFSPHCVLHLTPNKTTYGRLLIQGALPIHPNSKYLRRGSSEFSTVWTNQTFDVDGMQALGAPRTSGKPLQWGVLTDGLKTALELKTGPTPESGTATLVVRDTLRDRMLDFDRYRPRENFAFEIIHSDGSVQELKRNIWPFNRLKPEHQINRIFLRPTDEYRIELGDFDLSKTITQNTAVSIRAAIHVFTDEKRPDRPLSTDFTRQLCLESAWLPLSGPDFATALNDKPLDIPAIQVIVVDALSGQRLPNFTMIQGAVPERVDFSYRYDFPLWDSDSWRAGNAGRIDWPIKAMFRSAQFRVEVDGYAPGLSQVLDPQRPAVILIKLAQQAEFVGQVLSLDGKPVPKAQVAIVIGGSRVAIKEGQVELHDAALTPNNRWHQQALTTTDVDGQFRLPPEVTYARVIVTHESGYSGLTLGLPVSGVNKPVDNV